MIKIYENYMNRLNQSEIAFWRIAQNYIILLL